MRQKLAEFFDLLMGFRKFIAFMLIFLVSVILRLKGYLSGDNLASLLSTTFTAFAAGNMVEHFTSAVKQYVADKNAPADDSPAKDAPKEG